MGINFVQERRRRRSGGKEAQRFTPWCYSLRETQRQVGRRCGSGDGQSLVEGGRHSPHQIPASIHWQANAMERYPAVRASRNGQVVPRKSRGHRSKEHILQCQLKRPRLQVAG